MGAIEEWLNTEGSQSEVTLAVRGSVGSLLGALGDKAVRVELNVSTAGKGSRNGVYQDVVTHWVEAELVSPSSPGPSYCASLVVSLVTHYQG